VKYREPNPSVGSVDLRINYYWCQNMKLIVAF
jgi:hypothetical protein